MIYNHCLRSCARLLTYISSCRREPLEHVFGFDPTMMAADLRALAERLQPALKPSKGPTPEVPHIMAAILLARDCTLGGRAACRLVPGVYDEAAHSRVAKLAVKVRALLDEEPSPLPPESSPPPAQPPLPPAPPLAPPVFASERPQEEEQASSWDLPPLVATLEPPSAMSLSASPTTDELSPVPPTVLPPSATWRPASPLPTSTSPMRRDCVAAPLCSYHVQSQIITFTPRRGPQ